MSCSNSLSSDSAVNVWPDSVAIKNGRERENFSLKGWKSLAGSTTLETPSFESAVAVWYVSPLLTATGPREEDELGRNCSD